MVLIKTWHTKVLIFQLMNGWRWRDPNEPSNHFRLDYILFYSILTFFPLYVQIHQHSLLIWFTPWRTFSVSYLFSPSALATAGKPEQSKCKIPHWRFKERTSGDALGPHLWHPACTPPHLRPGRWQPYRSISLHQRGLACECLGSAPPGCSASSTLDPLQLSSCFSSR